MSLSVVLCIGWVDREGCLVFFGRMVRSRKGKGSKISIFSISAGLAPLSWGNMWVCGRKEQEQQRVRNKSQPSFYTRKPACDGGRNACSIWGAGKLFCVFKNIFCILQIVCLLTEKIHCPTGNHRGRV